MSSTQSSRRARTRWLGLDRLEARDVPTAAPAYAVLPALPGLPHPPPAAQSAPAFGPAAAPGSAPLGDTFKLHSRPGADKVVYLDFNGHSTFDTQWNADLNLPYGLFVPEYSVDDDWHFSDLELTNIQHIWERVAEDFSPFDLDITTEDPGLERLRNTGNGDTQWGVRVAIGGSGGDFGYPGGVAYVGSFTWDSDTPCYVFPKNLGNGDEKYTADAISHEAGHTLGLRHDGVGRTEYFAGHGGGATGWAPIMGVGYYRQVTQWSPGDYPGATNHQDDLAVITGQNGFGYRPDDHGNDQASATAATVTGPTGIFAAGVIETRTDVDYFSFTTGPGPITLTVRGARDPNLDVRAELYDAAGNRVAVANPPGGLGATLKATVPTGQYFVKIDGVGHGTAASGYTDYASLGQFSITGVVHQLPVADPPRVTGVTAVETGTGQVTGVRLTFSAPMDPASVTPAAIRVTGPAGQSVRVLGVFPVPASDTEFVVRLAPTAPAGRAGVRVYVAPTVHSTWSTALDQDGDNAPGEADDFFAAAVFRADAAGGPVADAATTDFPLTIDRSMPIEDVNVRVNLSHTYLGDLAIDLVSPAGKTVRLFDHRGGDGQDLRDTRFDDGAAGLASAAAPFAGLFRPDAGALADLVGDDAQGTWLLRITDSLAGAAGQLHSWGLTLTTDAARAGVGVVIDPVNEAGSALIQRIRSVDVTFSAPMNPATVTAADVTVVGPNGRPVRVTAMTPLEGTNNTRYRVTTAPWRRAGTYTVKVGPLVTDVFGNGLDGNGNGAFLDKTDGVASPTAVMANWYPSTAGPLTVPQRDYLSTPVTVPDAVTIGSVAVELNLAHPIIGNLILALIAPNGDRVVLTYYQGGTGSNLVRVVFADEAPAPLGIGPSQFSGDYQPFQPLSQLAGGSAKGTWRLDVDDTGYSGDLGTLLSWSLYVRPA